MDLMQRNTIQNIHTFISLRMQIHRKRKIENKKGGVGWGWGELPASTADIDRLLTTMRSLRM